MLNSLMNGSSLSNGLAQGIAATLAASNGGHQQPTQQTSVGNGLKEFLLEQHQLVRLVVGVVIVTQWARIFKKKSRPREIK